MNLQNEFTENGRTLTAILTGSANGDTPHAVESLRILVPGAISHADDKNLGAAVQMLVEKNGRHGAMLYWPITHEGRKTEVVAITQKQFSDCKNWIATTKSEILTSLTAEINARPEITIKWGGDPGFMNEDRRRGKLIEAELNLAGIRWTTDWDRHKPHHATLSRTQWFDEIKPLIDTALAIENSRIDAAIKQKSSPSKYAQLWEPCEKCSAEPSYQTPRGHLCENCL